jgi:hypothetical protein
MIARKNRYGRTAARIHDADGLARRPSSTTIDIHAHIVVPQAAKLAQPHVDISPIPLAVFGPDRIVMGTDYPFDMAEYNPIGHIAGGARHGRGNAGTDRRRQCRQGTRPRRLARDEKARRIGVR